jgi:hypothetical protein
MAIEPVKIPYNLTLFELQIIVRKVQEALWKDGPTGEWVLPEECEIDREIAATIAEILEEYDLQPVEIEEEPEEPVEGDLTTEDHVRFWQHQYGHRVPVVIVPGEDDWRPHVKAWMDKEHYWPNVWWVSDHWNWNRVSLEDE